MNFFCIDGNSIMNRTFYGIRALSNKKGIYTNAIFGFMNIFLKNIKELDPDIVIAAFDLKAPTFRHKADSDYKANRKPMPEELAMQMPYIKKILEYMGCYIITCEGYEADDILGTIAKMCSDSGNTCHILTGDRDSLQLINDNVTVHLAKNRDTISYTPDVFEAEYGFPPVNLIDLKALMGDASDNISGVKGIGEKTALKIIGEYHTIENLYDNIDTADLKPSQRTKLEKGREDAKKSKWLATINLNAPIEKNITYYKPRERDEKKLCEILVELEMSQLITKLNLSNMANEILSHNVVKNDTEITEDKKINTNINSYDLTQNDLNNIFKSNDIIYYLFENSTLKILFNKKIYLTNNKDYNLKFFESNSIKYTFSAKSHYRYALKNKSKLNNLKFDTEIGGYLLYPTESNYSIESLCEIEKIDFDSTIENIELIVLPLLSKKMLDKIKNLGMTDLLNDIEMPLIGVLASMEDVGVKVDADGVKNFGKYLDEQLKQTEQQIYMFAGHEFNILSPKQLGVVLFDELGLPARKKTKTGYSTNVDVLTELANKSPVAQLVLDYRQFAKLKSTYVDGLLKQIEEDGRIHTCYKQTEARTGRLSSTEPNLQNIPVRTDLGKNMRKFFIAEDENVLVDADYSQIELRVLANICGDENMIDTFLSGKDIHTKTASQVLGIPEELITPQMRNSAKAVNFGIIYGISAYSLSKDIDVSVNEAKKYIESYLKNFAKVPEFMDKTINDAKKNGYVKTIFGRIRPVPELNSKNKNVQAAAKRIAMNTPIQGTAADIIKKAMILVANRLEKEVPEAKLILQIHDELIVETPEKYADKVSTILTEEMENVYKMKVPFIADAKIGKNWYDAKS